MSQLKDLFTDYLVNYTNSPKNTYISETTTVEIPTNRYKNLLLYIDTKKDKNNTTTQEEEPEGFTHWVYSESSDDDSKTTKRTGILYLDNALWISDMTAAYKRAGLNDNAIKNLLAKNSVESNWGRSKLSGYNNFGGITAGKSWTGQVIESGDKDAGGNAITLRFRAYTNMDDYVKDEIQFLTKLYDFNQDDDISTFLDKLLGGNSAGRKYAEDPSYKNIIKSRYCKI